MISIQYLIFAYPFEITNKNSNIKYETTVLLFKIVISLLTILYFFQAIVASTSLLPMAVSLHLITSAPLVVVETVTVGGVVGLSSWI